MIITKLKGGLGNQLFQYSTGRALSLRTGSQLKLDISDYADQSQIETPRTFELARYKISAGISTAAETEMFISKYKTRSALDKLLGKIRADGYLEEKSFKFDPKILRSTGSVYLNGFWQSEQYFKAFRKQILEDLQLVNKPDHKNIVLSNNINSTNSVSLHIRRGDYTKKTAKEVHGALGLNYYQNAIKHFEINTIEPVFYVFSDDLNWAQENLKANSPIVFVDANDVNHGHLDMLLMSICNHNIIANSSFSWWGAWLNNNNSKVVIAPKQWFRNSPADTSTLIPNSWMKFNNDFLD